MRCDTTPPIIAAVDGRSYSIAASSALHFGRADNAELGVVGLDPDDTAISRVAGTVTSDNGLAVVTNRSSSANLYILGAAGTPIVLRPGHAHLLNGPTTLEIRGRILTHQITVDAPMPAQDGAVAPSGVAPTDVDLVRLTDNDRRALAAVFEGYLRPGRQRECVPESYADAGTRLGLPASTVRRRIERVRDRLAALGVYFDGPVAKEQLVAHLIDHDLLSADDLRLLDDG